MYTTSQLEALWSSHQINSLSQIAPSPEGPWTHIVQNIDLMNTFIDLQFQEQALQQSHVQQHLAHNKQEQPLVQLDSRQLKLKNLVKSLKTYKAIEEQQGKLQEEDKAFVLKELRKAKKLERQK